MFFSTERSIPTEWSGPRSVGMQRSVEKERPYHRLPHSVGMRPTDRVEVLSQAGIQTSDMNPVLLDSRLRGKTILEVREKVYSNPASRTIRCNSL